VSTGIGVTAEQTFVQLSVHVALAPQAFPVEVHDCPYRVGFAGTIGVGALHTLFTIVPVVVLVIPQLLAADVLVHDIAGTATGSEKLFCVLHLELVLGIVS
jgi:hypothetical protein